jgi:hypothetical protein
LFVVDRRDNKRLLDPGTAVWISFADRDVTLVPL